MYRVFAWAVAALAALAAGCATLPRGRPCPRLRRWPTPRTPGSVARSRPKSPPIREDRYPPAAQRRDAFAARVLLAGAAESRSTSSTTSGTATGRATCCSRRSGRRPTAACACACCSTISARCPPTPRCRDRQSSEHRGAHVQPRGPAFARGCSAWSPTSGASTSGCTTSRSPPTGRSPSSAAAISAMNISARMRR